MKKQIKRKIYFLSKAQMKPIEVVQYETGVQLVFEVQDIELDTSATATLFVRKPSGKFVFQEDNISLTGNTVVVDLHNQAITEHGHPFFQIKFKKDEEVISTYSGMLTVEKSLDDSGAEESKTVFAAFDEFTDEQIARIEEATRSQIDLMKAEVEAKGETVLATIPDEYTEMYNRVNTLFNSVANAIKGTVSGSVVRVDDVSPVEHKPVVKVICPEGVVSTTVTVTKCGKNLIPLLYTQNNKVDNGVTFDTFSSGAIGMKGTSSDYALFFINSTNIELQSGVSYDLIQPNTSKARLIMNYLNENGGSEWIGSTIVWKDSYTFKSLYIQIDPNVVIDEVYVPIIKRTDEPIERWTPSSDGTVEGITSLSPVMTLLTDTEGVTIECEYIKDTGKVIDNLTKAVVALGGVV